jgi:hypothetical protein
MEKSFLTQLAEWFTIFGFFVSFVSLVISVFVLVNVRNIKNFYRMKVRGPELFKELHKYSSDLAGSLEDFRSNTAEIRVLFAQSESKLTRLATMSSGQTKKRLIALRKAVSDCKVTPANEEEVFGIYVEMKKALEEVKDHQKDTDLER